MPYTPPAGNAVDFDFTDIHYVRPPAHSIIFNFGAIPGPPFIDDQLPTARRIQLFEEPEWQKPFTRKFAPIQDVVVGLPMKALQSLDQDDVQLWNPMSRRILVVPPFPVSTIRPTLFTVT